MNDWNKQFILKVIGAIMVVLLFVYVCYQCSGKPVVHDPGTIKKLERQSDSLLKLNRSLEKRTSALQKIALSKNKEVLIYRDRWHRSKEIVRHDTVIYEYCHEIVQNCDSLIERDSVLIQVQDFIIKSQGSMIVNYKSVRANDSTAIAGFKQIVSDTCKYFRKKIRKEKWQKRGILAAWILSEGIRLKLYN